MEQISIHITHDNLSVDTCREFVNDPSCGGIAVFVGTVRNNTRKKAVHRLEFSAYEPMAIKEMEKIAKKALKKFNILKIAMHHAVGTLDIGEIPVVIAASAPHREAAFQACQYAIDTLKKTVPIWKKELFDDGDVWVNAHP
jgi:molybdopterin synthase catalytic subunit